MLVQTWRGTLCGRTVAAQMPNSQCLSSFPYAQAALVTKRVGRSLAPPNSNSTLDMAGADTRNGSVYAPPSGASSTSSQPKQLRSVDSKYEAELRTLEAIFQRSLRHARHQSQHAPHGAIPHGPARSHTKAPHIKLKPAPAQADLQVDSMPVPDMQSPPELALTDAEVHTELQLARQQLEQQQASPMPADAADTITTEATATVSHAPHLQQQPAAHTRPTDVAAAAAATLEPLRHINQQHQRPASQRQSQQQQQQPEQTMQPEQAAQPQQVPRSRVRLQQLSDYTWAQPLTQPAKAPAARPRSTRQQDVITVRDLVMLATGQTEHRILGRVSLQEAVKQAKVIVVNAALSVLGKASRVPQVQQLMEAARTTGQLNTYTWGCAFQALADAGRPDAAFNLFDKACQQGADIGPVGASTMVKLCSNQRDLDLALELYYRMVSIRTTFNRYTYNCLLHLSALLGRVHDALDVLGAMRVDARTNPDCAPDGYSYSAVLRAITASGKFELLPKIYKMMTSDGVTPDAEVWCQLITLAGRAGQTQLAIAYFNACLRSGCELNTHAYNALLIVLASVSDLDQTLLLYRQMLESGLTPDSYTFVAILSTMARTSSSMHAVEDVVLEMHRWGVGLNTQLGTALANAYRRAPEMQYNDKSAVALLLERADDVLARLAANRQATNQTYAIVASMHAQARDLAGMQRLLQQGVRQSVVFDATSYKLLAEACEEAGLMAHAEQLRRQTDALLREERAKKRAGTQIYSSASSSGTPGSRPGATGAAGRAAGHPNQAAANRAATASGSGTRPRILLAARQG